MAEATEVIITLKEVYEVQQNQGIVQIEINSKLDRLLDKHDRIDESVADHETRIRSLEQTRWPLPSLAAIVAVASLVWSLVK